LFAKREHILSSRHTDYLSREVVEESKARLLVTVIGDEVKGQVVASRRDGCKHCAAELSQRRRAVAITIE